MMEGIGLRVRRPNDYNPTIAATLGPSAPNPGLNLAGRLLRTSTRPTLNRRTESPRLYEHSP